MTRSRRGGPPSGPRPPWDDVTAATVGALLGPRPRLTFFTPAEEEVARPLIALLLRARGKRPRPVLEYIDGCLARLDRAEGHSRPLPGGCGDGEIWRRSLAALDKEAALRHAGRGFAELDTGDRHRLLRHVRDLGPADWYGMPAELVWALWDRYVCAACAARTPRSP